MPKSLKGDSNSPVVASLVRRQDKKEALDWLLNPPAGVSRSVSEMTTAESVALVRRLDRMHAPRVDVVKATSSPSGKYESTDYLICALPTDPTSRVRILEWERKRAFKMGYEESEDDRGQTHLLIWFD